MPSKSNGQGKANGNGSAPTSSAAAAAAAADAADTVGIEMTERRGPSSASSGGRRYPRLSAEIDEPLLRERGLRDDDGAIIHDDISDLDDSQASECEDDEKEANASDDPFRPRRMSISEPARILGRTGARFRDLKNFMMTGGFENQKGMNVPVTALFIIGETAGGGLVALPIVMANCGILLGTLVIILGALICGYAGVQLADCWSIMMLRYQKYRFHTNKPYPAIGRRACGRWTGIGISLILNVTQYMTAVVFLLLGSKNVSSAVAFFFGVQISFCYIIVIVACLIFPLILLRSPKDFWIPIMFAMCTTMLACVLLVLGAYLDSAVCWEVNVLPEFDFDRIIKSFGTVMFAYGGHGAFPTIQHDMKHPHKFDKAVTGAFTGIACLYLPVSLAGALVYGNSLGEVVIFSIQTAWIQQTVNLLITLHVFLALTIVFNPMNQDIEQLANVPEPFGIKRVFYRGMVLVAVVFAAVTVPNFGPLLDLVGASTITLMAIVLPPLFALYLKAKLNKFGTKGSHLEPLRLSDLWKHNRGLNFFFNIVLIVIGVVIGGYSSYSSLHSIMNLHFQRPCYADFLFGAPETVMLTNHADAGGISITQKFLCCGPGKNVSSYGIEYCLDQGTVASLGSHG